MTPNGLGLQVDEERGPDQSIARLGTARTAFVGRTLRGPVNQPVFVKGFAKFQQVFGGLWQPSPLGYAVEHFFDNGGREAYVVRVANGARAATLSLPAGAQILTLRAVRPGTREFLRASVDFDNIPDEAVAEFNLTVQRVRLLGTEQVEDQEIFLRLSVLQEAARYVGTVLAESALARLAGPVPIERPDQTFHSVSGLAAGYLSSNADGDDGAPLTDYDVIGSRVERTGIFALDGVEYFNLLCIPPLSREQDVGASLLLVAARYCKEHRAMLVVDPPAEWHTAEEALRGLRQWNFCTENALMYFPRILAHDKLRGRFESFGSSGAVAGMLARVDEAFPIWGSIKIEDAVLRPGYRPACIVTEGRRMRLASCGVNAIQAVRSAARIGVQPRTLAAGTAGAPDWQYLAARRLALFILNSIERGTRWVMLTKPHREVSGLATVQVAAFFEGLRAQGAFGDRPVEESYVVICDQRANTIDSASSDFHLLIGFAAQRGTDFHCYRISHSTKGSCITPVSLNRVTTCQFSLEELKWIDTLANQLRP